MRNWLLLLALLGPLSLSAQQADIQITTPIPDPEIQAAFEYAASIWEQYLQSEVPIKVNAIMLPVNGAFLGLCLPNGRKDFPGAPLTDTWYPTALANALAGEELNPGESDMDIYLALDVNWYLGTDGNPAFNQYDLVSTFLHEIGHGLGIISLGDRVANEGSFGQITLENFDPLQTSFSFPDLDGYPGAFDRLLADGSGELLTLLDNPGVELGNAFVSQNIYFSGTLAGQANNDAQVPVFAPAGFLFGSSLSHLDENAFPAGSPNSLMTPFSSTGEVEHEPGPVALGILSDIGWEIGDFTARESPSPSPAITIFPQPAKEVIYLQGLSEAKDYQATLFSLQGQPIQQFSFKGGATCSIHLPGHIPPGHYILEITSTNNRTHHSLIVN
jgi:hypothetical protein